ncbi:MAG: hypothetical protein H6739_20510 [Alphaproteobacteria bacterium]|nr:hypothetical protein [Alphaproteobacteria bacterium]
MMLHPRQALAELLLSLMDHDQLRRLLARLPQGEDILALEHPASPEAFVDSAVAALERRALIDRSFFDLLIDTHPRRRADIERIAAMWAEDTSDPDTFSELLPQAFAPEEAQGWLESVPLSTEESEALQESEDVFERARKAVALKGEAAVRSLQQARPARAREIAALAAKEGLAAPGDALAPKGSAAPLKVVIACDRARMDDARTLGAALAEVSSMPHEVAVRDGGWRGRSEAADRLSLFVEDLPSMEGPIDLLVVLLGESFVSAGLSPHLPPLPPAIRLAVPILIGAVAGPQAPLPARWHTLLWSWAPGVPLSGDREAAWLKVAQGLRPLMEALHFGAPLPTAIPGPPTPPQPSAKQAPPEPAAQQAPEPAAQPPPEPPRRTEPPPLPPGLVLGLRNDRPTPDDALGFGPYARALADLLAHPDTRPPLTVSVEGAWGAGKSSFLLQLEDALRKKYGDNMVTLRFNAWRYEQAEAMWSAFALGMLREMERGMGWWPRLRARLALRLRRARASNQWEPLVRGLVLTATGLALAVLVVLLPGTWTLGVLELIQGDAATPPWVSVLGKPGSLVFHLAIALGGLGAIGAKLRGLWDSPLAEDLRAAVTDPGYTSHTPFLDQLHDDLRFMLDAFAQKRTVFVFVDDLDRCEVPRAAELMQAVNLLLLDPTDRDAPPAPVIFVLAMDREKVAAGFAARHKAVLPYLNAASSNGAAEGMAGLEYGYAFIEKFLQLPFRLPTPDLRALSAMAFRNPDAQAAADAATQQDYLRLILRAEAVDEVLPLVVPALGQNPRRLKQLLNLYALQARLAAEAGALAVGGEPHKLTKERLAKLVAMALRWPALVTDLHREAGLLEALQIGALAPESIAATKDLSARTRRWLARPELMAFLATGCRTLDDPASLAHVDVRVVLGATPLRGVD